MREEIKGDDKIKEEEKTINTRKYGGRNKEEAGKRNNRRKAYYCTN